MKLKRKLDAYLFLEGDTNGQIIYYGMLSVALVTALYSLI